MTATCPIIPSKDGYSVRRSSPVTSVQLDGGPSANRLKALGAPSIVDVTFVTNGDDYVTLDAFYITTLVYGVLPFNIGLVLEAKTRTTHLAKIVPGSWSLQSVSGDTWTTVCQLEVQT